MDLCFDFKNSFLEDGSLVKQAVVVSSDDVLIYDSSEFHEAKKDGIVDDKIKTRFSNECLDSLVSVYNQGVRINIMHDTVIDAESGDHGFTFDAKKESEKLLVRIKITNKDAIEYVRKNKLKAVSQGYDILSKKKDVTGKAHYVIDAIKLNHLSLCYEGRAGSAKIFDKKKEKVGMEKEEIERMFKDMLEGQKRDLLSEKEKETMKKDMLDMQSKIDSLTKDKEELKTQMKADYLPRKDFEKLFKDFNLMNEFLDKNRHEKKDSIEDAQAFILEKFMNGIKLDSNTAREVVTAFCSNWLNENVQKSVLDFQSSNSSKNDSLNFDF